GEVEGEPREGCTILGSETNQAVYDSVVAAAVAATAHKGTGENEHHAGSAPQQPSTKVPVSHVISSVVCVPSPPSSMQGCSIAVHSIGGVWHRMREYTPDESAEPSKCEAESFARRTDISVVAVPVSESFRLKLSRCCFKRDRPFIGLHDSSCCVIPLWM